MAAPLLPFDRDLTPEERRGFRIACACMKTFGHQIEAQGVRLGGPALPPVPRDQVMRMRGAAIVFVAEALDMTIGQGRAPG